MATCLHPRRVELPDGRRVWLACRARTCPRCGPLWQGDQRQRVRSNLIDGHGGPVAMLTITAPSLPAAIVAPWNATAAPRWSAMHRAIRRHLGRTGQPIPRLLAYTWAHQARGSLHLHVVLAADAPRDRAALVAYTAALRDRARGHGFGYVHVRRELAAKTAASYLARNLADLDPYRVAPTRTVYLARELLRRTGVTMRALRIRRYLWRLARRASRALQSPPPQDEGVPQRPEAPRSAPVRGPPGAT